MPRIGRIAQLLRVASGLSHRQNVFVKRFKWAIEFFIIVRHRETGDCIGEENDLGQRSSDPLFHLLRSKTTSQRDERLQVAGAMKQRAIGNLSSPG